jgi:DNA helicase IV
VNAFISLLKANRKGLPEIAKFQMESEQIKNTFQRNRTRLFFKIVRGAYAHYSDYLDKTNKIDFHDMINDAADIVAAREVKLPYRYIIIDEFQDTSMSRYNLVKAIKEENSARLFCVGDDWQSIYRFAGSDLEIFTGFDKMVGETNLLKIENTYRNPQSLIDIAGNFVMSNNNQYRKNLISSNKKHEQPVCIVGYEKDPMDAFERAINDIVKAIPEVREVMIIGRNNFDINFIDNFSEFKKSYSKKEDAIVIRYSKYPDIRFQYLTAHRSKGLEAEATIIINVNNNSIGFPNKIADDALLGYILTKREPYRFAEERRLFYVALTRTRNLTYITTKHASRSEFVIELIERYKVPYVRTGNPNTEERVVHCPECIKGQLISKKKYVYCSNYPRCEFGTGYTEIMKNPIKCPRCHYFLVDRVMKRNGHHFLGCMNYPRCSHTEEYDS